MFAAHPRPGSMNLRLRLMPEAFLSGSGCTQPAHPNRNGAESFIFSTLAKIFSIRLAIPVLRSLPCMTQNDQRLAPTLRWRLFRTLLLLISIYLTVCVVVTILQ